MGHVPIVTGYIVTVSQAIAKRSQLTISLLIGGVMTVLKFVFHVIQRLVPVV